MKTLVRIAAILLVLTSLTSCIIAALAIIDFEHNAAGHALRHHSQEQRP